MDNTKIIHLHFREPKEGRDQDYYFGSLAAIYDLFSSDEVGIKYNSLVNLFSKRGRRLETPLCIINGATIIRKKRTAKS